MLLFFVTTISHSLLYAVKPASPEGDSEKITLEMLNCKMGVYKTYNDFVNNQPSFQDYTYFGVGFSVLGNSMKLYDIVFQDKAKKKVSVEPKDFWGFKSQFGKLFRTGNFVNGKVSKICFLVKYSAKDLVVYEPLDPVGLEITPSAWCSASLSDEVLPADEFFKTHPKQKAAYTEIEAAVKNCLKWPAGKRLNRDQELYRESSCIAQITGIIGWYDYLASFPDHKVKTIGSYIKK